MATKVMENYIAVKYKRREKLKVLKLMILSGAV